MWQQHRQLAACMHAHETCLHACHSHFLRICLSLHFPDHRLHSICRSQEGKQAASGGLHSAPISLAGAQFSQLSGVPLAQLSSATLAQLQGAPLQQISVQQISDLGQLTALPLSLAQLTQLGVTAEDGTFRLAAAPALQLAGPLAGAALGKQAQMGGGGPGSSGMEGQDQRQHQQVGEWARQTRAQ